MLPSPNGLARRDVLKAGATFAAASLIGGCLATPGHAAAPMLGAAQPKFWRYRLGAFELTTLSDSEAFIDGPFPLIGANAPEADVLALMRDNRLPEKRYQPGFSPTVLNTGKELILFDTGNGANGFVPRPHGGWLAAQLGPAGFKREDIDIVVLTHGHPDHIGGMIEGGAPLFPNARYVISTIENDFWAPAGKHSGELEKFASVYRAHTSDVAARFSFIKPGDDVVTGVRAVEAYGHTPGHLAFMIESEAKAVLFWGDCAHHHVASLARPDWHCVFDTDREAAAKTRKRIFDMVATERLAVIGYHMPFPSLGHVERLNAGSYRWVPHSFQFNE